MSAALYRGARDGAARVGCPAAARGSATSGLRSERAHVAARAGPLQGLRGALWSRFVVAQGGCAHRPGRRRAQPRSRSPSTRSFTDVMATPPSASGSPITGPKGSLEIQIGPSAGSGGTSPWLPFTSPASSGMTSIR